MTITARYPSRCATCGAPIIPGQQIEWERGSQPRHTHCPEQPAESHTHAAAAPRGVRTNAKRAACSACGTMLAPGTGRLWQCCGSSSNCREHWESDGGWHVSCLDSAACKSAREERIRKAEAERAREIEVAAIIPQRWAGAHGAERLESGERWAQTTWRIEVRSDTMGTVDKGSFGVDGEDLIYRHGGYYDDYQESWALIPGGAAEYRAALEATMPELPAGRTTRDGYAWSVDTAANPAAPKLHETDADCTIDPITNECTICGAWHGDPCLECHGTGFHKPGCSEYEGDEGDTPSRA